MTTRIYVAGTPALLAEWHDAGAVPADAARVLAPADDEDVEYDALMTAAVLSAELLPEGGRRVVVVAETSGTDTEGPLGLLDWVAVHCDVTDRPADADPADDLAWFATQEIDAILAD